MKHKNADGWQNKRPSLQDSAHLLRSTDLNMTCQTNLYIVLCPTNVLAMYEVLLIVCSSIA